LAGLENNGAIVEKCLQKLEKKLVVLHAAVVDKYGDNCPPELSALDVGEAHKKLTAAPKSPKAKVPKKAKPAPKK